MNNKGQTLVLFLLIMPIIVSFLAFFIDLSTVFYEKSRIESIITSNLSIILDDNINDVETINNVFKENKINSLKIEVLESKIIISINKPIKSIFGQILHFDFYILKSQYSGDYNNKEINKIG